MIYSDNKFELSQYLYQRQTLIEAQLEQAIPIEYPETIYESMRYSLLSKGKRLRPIFCLATCELFDGSLEIARRTACAIEMLHTASLIHDDLPCMDNDDYRRDKLSNHKLYGESTAILVGDALLSYAFEYILLNTKNVPAEQLLLLILKLSQFIGVRGLVAGQFVDLQSEGAKNLDVEMANFINKHKTGSLFKASILSGALLANAPPSVFPKLSDCADYIGLAFQIIDDIIDYKAMKNKSEDKINIAKEELKITYPKLYGVEKSKIKAQQLINEAKQELNNFGTKAIPLITLFDYILSLSY